MQLTSNLHHSVLVVMMRSLVTAIATYMTGTVASSKLIFTTVNTFKALEILKPLKTTISTTTIPQIAPPFQLKISSQELDHLCNQAIVSSRARFEVLSKRLVGLITTPLELYDSHHRPPRVERDL